MSYTITISEKIEGEETPTLRYSQCLDQINLPAIIAAVNTKPPRVRDRSKERKRISREHEHLSGKMKAAVEGAVQSASKPKSDEAFLEFTEKEGK